MARHGRGDWSLPQEGLNWDHVQVAVLMDLRDELQKLNRLLACPNFVAIPQILRDIKKNTTKRKRKPSK